MYLAHGWGTMPLHDAPGSGAVKSCPTGAWTRAALNLSTFEEAPEAKDAPFPSPDFDGMSNRICIYVCICVHLYICRYSVRYGALLGVTQSAFGQVGNLTTACTPGAQPPALPAGFGGLTAKLGGALPPQPWLGGGGGEVRVLRKWDVQLEPGLVLCSGK